MPADSAIWALVPAAGTGSRMQAALPKQYLPLLGRPVILHTLERLTAHARVRGVLVGVGADDPHWRGLGDRLGAIPKLLGSYAGGATRAQTVLNGLEALAAQAHPDDWVLVHDAVRPCVRVADVEALIREVESGEEGGLLALPVSDTVKRVNADRRVLETVPRANLWRALTPQMFRLARLRSALAQALARGAEVTDEAAAVEAAGGRPRVVAGHPDNIKITLPEDLVLAELFLRQQGIA